MYQAKYFCNPYTGLLRFFDADIKIILGIKRKFDWHLDILKSTHKNGSIHDCVGQ